MAVSSMQVGVGHERQEARTLDRGAQLALVVRLGAGDAGRDDAAVFSDEFLQHLNVLVVDLNHLVGGEAAELATLEETAVAAVAALVGELAAGFSTHGTCHDFIPFRFDSISGSVAGCSRCVGSARLPVLPAFRWPAGPTDRQAFRLPVLSTRIPPVLAGLPAPDCC